MGNIRSPVPNSQFSILNSQCPMPNSHLLSCQQVVDNLHQNHLYWSVHHNL
ncbi:MAG: hypothetical protein KME30_19795 [Iphinoe sp. HA4291-MV1]|nr:hypothetical protein [Iphinoe sp. HA4291-MV1]